MTEETAPALSVLVPTYNYADYIGEAITSVLEQAVPGLEIVVADDGSTDHTEQVLRPWIESGQIRYFRQDNSGPASARNLAIAKARGRILMFLDADDSLLAGCIPTTLEFMSRHPDVGFFFTNYDLFDETGVTSPSGVDTWKVFRTLPHDEVAPGEWLFTESLAYYIIRYGGFMHTSGLTVRREAAERAGPFREGYFYGEDDEFYARVARICRSGYVDRVLSRKRNHPASVIHDPSKSLRNTTHLLELAEIQLGDYAGETKIEAVLHRRIRSCAASCAWALIQRKRHREARALLRRYLPRYPLHWPFYKLLAKSYLDWRNS